MELMMPEQEPLLFLSYARKDVAIVRDLYRNLKQSGYRPWMDLEDLLPGEDWELKVKQKIENALFFVACLSTNSVSHEGIVQMEFKEALEIAKRKLSSNIFFIPARLNDCLVPDEMKRYNWVDLYKTNGFNKLLEAIRAGMARRGLTHDLTLRSTAVVDLATNTIHEMVEDRGFFNSQLNWEGQGILHQYEQKGENDAKVILDHTTRLTWQQAGSSTGMRLEKAKSYIEELNENGFGSNQDWRLPTIEEAMSLVEKLKNNDGLHISTIFFENQNTIWTADMSEGSRAWVVSFDDALCFSASVDDEGVTVRAVRAGID